MKKNVNADVPKLPHAFFKWYCKPERYEELHGDLEELFHEQIEARGVARARLNYFFNVIRCCQPYAWRKTNVRPYSNVFMIRNYYTTSIRSLMKNPLGSFINVFGLSVALGVCIVVYAFMEYAYSIDNFHQHKDNVFLTTYFIERDGVQEQYGTSPRPLGEMLREDFAHVKKVCRLEDKSVVLKHEDKVFHEQVRYADAAFLEMFTFPLKWGSAGSLSDPSNIILSGEMAVKYFGSENPLGKEMLMIFNDGRNKAFKITGVAEAFPKAHAIDFNFLVNFENTKAFDLAYDLADWKAFVNATLIQVDDPSQIGAIEQGMKKYKILQNKALHDWAISSFAMVSIADLYKSSGSIRNDISTNPPIEAQVAMPIIAIFLLALACFNYINLSIVSATRRLKEIGVRKVIGADRGKVIFQFLSENILVTVLAGVVGLILAFTVFLPWFVQLTSRPLELSLLDKDLWIYLPLILLFTGIVSGLYPAFYISRFDAVKIFRGSVKFGSKNPLTKFLLGVQLVLACILITGAIMYMQNTTYQNNQSWGYSQKQVLYAGVQDHAAFQRLHDVMIRDPHVLSISGSEHHLGKSTYTRALQYDNQQYEVNELAVDAGYFETMGLQLKEGRVFREHSENDRRAVVVNDLLVKRLGLEQPIGKLIQLDSMKYEVIGVLKDFHSNSFYHEMRPALFTVVREDDYHYLSVRVSSGEEKQAMEVLQTQWAKLFPEIPFQGGRQEDVWGVFFSQLETQETFTRAIALIAVLLASLGFYGLVTFNVSGRTKEFSLRKVLGAEIRSIASEITKQYVLLVLVAVAIGVPVSFILIKAMLSMLYAYPIPMGFSGVIIAVVILTAVLLAVIYTQVFRLSKLNPLNGLKTE